MWFFLSSGARPRYLDDVVRALALPAGAEIMFRYDKKHLSGTSTAFLCGGGCADAELVIAYLDRENKAHVPVIIPCRRAKIKEVFDYGVTVTVVMVVGDLTVVKDVDEYQKAIRMSGANLPLWSNGHLEGEFIVNMDDPCCQFAAWGDVGAWHRVVGQLCERSEMSKRPIFVRLTGASRERRRWGNILFWRVWDGLGGLIRGLWKEICGIRANGKIPAAADKAAPTLRKWGFSGNEPLLKPNSGYKFDVYHFHPSNEAKGYNIKFQTTDRKLVTPTSSEMANVDSRYDQKTFRFETGAAVFAHGLAFLIQVLDTEGKTHIEFELATAIKGSIVVGILRSVVIGAFVAAPGILATSAADRNTLAITIYMLIFGFCAGLASTYLLPKAP